MLPYFVPVGGFMLTPRYDDDPDVYGAAVRDMADCALQAARSMGWVGRARTWVSLAAERVRHRVQLARVRLPQPAGMDRAGAADIMRAMQLRDAGVRVG